VDEVKLSLMMSILDKRKDEALFWAFELYHSGFVTELGELILNIYDDFYATLNPTFEKHVTNQTTITETDLYEIISNMMTKQHNADVYLLKKIVEQFEIESSTDDSDLLAFASFILEEPDTSLVLTTLQNLGVFKLSLQAPRKLMLVRFMQHKQKQHDIESGSTKKRVLFIKKKNDNDMYEVDIANVRTYKILELVTKYGIDEHNYLSLFNLKRDREDIVGAYRNYWLGCAARSPVWLSRILAHGGSVTEAGMVVFENDELEQEFANKYNLEPDEQKLETQNKTTQYIKKERTWAGFCKEHNAKGLVKFDEDILADLIKV
jgi:hypothetical protein